MYLSTCGKNDDKVYVKADLNESAADFEDDFVRKLQKTVISRLNIWLKAAARAKSIDQFREEMQ